jgi:hypothetical protein
MVLAGVLAGDKISHRNLAVFEFSHKMIQKSGFIMASHAGYIFVTRNFPGFNIRVHIMA